MLSSMVSKSSSISVRGVAIETRKGACDAMLFSEWPLAMSASASMVLLCSCKAAPCLVRN
eukprot:4436705-Amphidinium_carterae.2